MNEKEKQAKKDFIAYLAYTLIPDLEEEGLYETAKDFKTCLKYMRSK